MCPAQGPSRWHCSTLWELWSRCSSWCTTCSICPPTRTPFWGNERFICPAKSATRKNSEKMLRSGCDTSYISGERSSPILSRLIKVERSTFFVPPFVASGRTTEQPSSHLVQLTSRWKVAASEKWALSGWATPEQGTRRLRLPVPNHTAMNEPRRNTGRKSNLNLLRMFRRLSRNHKQVVRKITKLCPRKARKTNSFD